MTAMNQPDFDLADSVHRLVKQAMDSGEARTLEEAQALFQGYRLDVIVAADATRCPKGQMAILTTVALARRVFLGGVFVSGPLNTALRLPLPLGSTLADAIAWLGGLLAEGRSDSVPAIVIGNAQIGRSDAFCVRLVAEGWRGGIVPANLAGGIDPAAMPLAVMLACALAVNEGFLHVRGEGTAAGRRSVGLSLWRPDRDADWRDPSSDGPALRHLPKKLWLIGLGHLGQAYLWGLGLLPYETPSEVQLVLQDFDVITPSTESTSVLSDSTLVGQKKTRAMAAWAEARGFSPVIYERRFDASFTRQDDEPAIALCGLDNALARQALDQVGFKLVVEAGLGHGYHDFRTMRLHTLPGPKPAREIWKAATPRSTGSADQPAYKNLKGRDGLDQCGVTLLAGKAVGAPFVGAAAAPLVLAEILRFLEGGPSYRLIDLDLKAIDQRTAVPRTTPVESFNPGLTGALTEQE